jgi:hypothetical protein
MNLYAQLYGMKLAWTTRGNDCASRNLVMACMGLWPHERHRMTILISNNLCSKNPPFTPLFHPETGLHVKSSVELKQSSYSRKAQCPSTGHVDSRPPPYIAGWNWIADFRNIAESHNFRIARLSFVRNLAYLRTSELCDSKVVGDGGVDVVWGKSEKLKTENKSFLAEAP